MSYVLMKAPVVLYAGCELRLKKGMSREKVSFARYAEIHVGPLDRNGRRMGRYLNPFRLVVAFPNGSKQEVATADVELIDSYPKPLQAALAHAGEFGFDERLGDLPYELPFWPDDVVHVNSICKGPKNAYLKIESVQLIPGRTPLYHFPSTGGTFSRTEDEMELTQEGNVRSLYVDEPLKMIFKSDEDELAFWAREGISAHALGKRGGQTMWPCAESFRSGHADIITSKRYYSAKLYHTYDLHPYFAQYRPRTRELTERVFGKEMDEALAHAATLRTSA